MGLFEDEITPDDGVTLDPGPDLGGFAPPAPMAPMMGPQTPMPTPPQAPGGQSNMQRILSMALTGLAAGLGPRRGGGIPQGVLLGQHQNDQAQQQRFQNEQLQYREQAQQAQQQQQLQAQQQRDAEVRAQHRQQAVKSIADIVPTLTTKKEYDDFIDRSGQWLLMAGHRDLSPNALRSAFPYKSPDAAKRAKETLDKFLKSDFGQQQMKDDPDAVKGGSLNFDRQGDGVKGPVPVQELMQIAGMGMLTDDKGRPVGTVPSKDGPLPQVKLRALSEKFYAEKRAWPKGDDLAKLVDEAAKTGKDTEMSDLTKALAKQRLNDAQNKPHGGLDDRTKRRVDMKTKGFDSQPVVKRVQTMASAVDFLKSMSNDTQNPSDDQGLLYAFAKAMDPDSVVREGEYKTVQKYAQSWTQSFGFEMKRVLMNGPFLTPQARANMKATILSKFAAERRQYDNLRRSYSDQINKITGSDDGETYLIDYGGAFPEDLKAQTRKQLGLQ